MSEVVLRTDATFGLKVKIGDKVRKGRKIGTEPNTQCSVASPIRGVVKSVSFDSESHEFLVVVSSTK
jgi:Na+-translocating ferredoxin:NAD+ oxidoreductase RnfC subunit